MERFVGTEVAGSRWEQFVPISGLMHQVKAVKFDDGLPQGLLLVERAVPRPQNDLNNTEQGQEKQVTGDKPDNLYTLLEYLP